MTLPTTSCEPERKFHKLSIIKKNKFQSTMLKKTLNYLSIIYTENYITKPLSYDEAIKEYTAERSRKKGITEMCQAIS
jgi:hypothetical protein